MEFISQRTKYTKTSLTKTTFRLFHWLSCEFSVNISLWGQALWHGWLSCCLECLHPIWGWGSSAEYHAPNPASCQCAWEYSRWCSSPWVHAIPVMWESWKEFLSTDFGLALPGLCTHLGIQPAYERFLSFSPLSLSSLSLFLSSKLTSLLKVFLFSSYLRVQERRIHFFHYI